MKRLFPPELYVKVKGISVDTVLYSIASWSNLETSRSSFDLKGPYLIPGPPRVYLSRYCSQESSFGMALVNSNSRMPVGMCRWYFLGF
jgi:hypothetical protein